MTEYEILLEIGNNLKAERNRKGLSQEGLAEKANLSLKEISNIENAKTKANVITILKVLKALNITFDKLYEIK